MKRMIHKALILQSIVFAFLAVPAISEVNPPNQAAFHAPSARSVTFHVTSTFAPQALTFANVFHGDVALDQAPLDRNFHDMSSFAPPSPTLAEVFHGDAPLAQASLDRTFHDTSSFAPQAPTLATVFHGDAALGDDTLEQTFHDISTFAGDILNPPTS